MRPLLLRSEVQTLYALSSASHYRCERIPFDGIHRSAEGKLKRADKVVKFKGSLKIVKSY